ncbi:hypothetical protein MYP_4962 [Sporocytophaga myxococcoides]|uniref:Uncharacterized protein n=1 Tax=Sporocytophaga myxococcoides TaxID=153721 RepID=A0A098LL98_9BACT|nr:hypothetical protein MYP_4962 [Sporocytophaga myxococcoides]
MTVSTGVLCVCKDFSFVLQEMRIVNSKNKILIFIVIIVIIASIILLKPIELPAVCQR